MTEQEFEDAWDRGDFDYEFDEYCYDRYPINRDAAYEDFKDAKLFAAQPKVSQRVEEKAREAWADALDDLRAAGKIL